MLYFIFIFGSIIIGIIMGIVQGWDIVDRILGSLLGLLFGGVVGILLAFLFMGGAHLIFDTGYVHYDNQEIYALQDNMGVEGQFFLGSGSVDSKLKYYFMVKESRGMNIQSVDASNSYINETDNVQPNIDYYEQRFKNKFVQWLTPAWPNTENEIEIPKDSIIQNYEINLK